MFGFQHPLWLYAAAFSVLVWLLYRYRARRQRQDWQQVGDAVVLEQFTERPKRGSGLGYALALASLCIALAHPQWGRRTDLLAQRSQDIYLVMDLSQSMLTRDVPPSRLERAKRFARALLPELEQDRVGLILFACNAYLEMPLSHDWRVADLLIEALNVDKALVQGTALPAAFAMAEATTGKNADRKGILLLLSDGEDHRGGAADAAATAREQGWTIFTIGVGSVEGGWVPRSATSEEYLMDGTHQPVRSKLDEAALQAVAKNGGGQYWRLGSADESTVRAVRKALDQKARRQSNEKAFVRAESYFQPFLLLSLLLLFWQYYRP